MTVQQISTYRENIQSEMSRHEKAIRDKYKMAGSIISKAGNIPIPVNNTLLKLLTYFIYEDELDFVISFKNRKSQTMDQLKESSGLSGFEINTKVQALAARGVIFNQPNRQGVMVYRLLPLINVGALEYAFMGKLEKNPRNQEISVLLDQLFQDLSDLIQKNYDILIPFFKKASPVDRTVPMTKNKVTGQRVRIIAGKSLDSPLEEIVTSEDVKEIIEKFDDIALGHCFCRHHKDMGGSPCRQTELRETCFTFGKSARYTSEQGFARMISKQEALEVLKRAEEDGLVHKAYHPNSDILRAETSICNCCRCCCANSVENMIVPITNATNFLAVVDPEVCTGCGTCSTKCHTSAAFIDVDGIAQIKTDRCIGCGVCASFCPENAIRLFEGRRIVRIIPERR